MSDLKREELGALCAEFGGKIQTGPFGSQLHAEEYTSSGIPVIMPKDISEKGINDNSIARISETTAQRLNRHKVSNGDIIFPRRGEITKSALINEKDEGSICGSGCLKITLPENILYPLYIKYYLSTQKVINWLNDSAVGSTMKNLSASIMSRLPVIYPTYTAQKKITSILSSLDEKIELNNRINAELEAMAKTLYDYWFVQFEFPNEDGKPYKSSGGKMTYNPELKREIPDGWEVKTIGDYENCKSGYAYKSQDWISSGTPVIKIKDIHDDYTLSLNNFSYVSQVTVKDTLKYQAHFGSIVIAMTGATIGKFAIVPKLNTQIFVNQRVGLFNLGHKPFQRLPFLFNSMKQPYFRDMIFLFSCGAAQPNISSDQINNIPLLFPTLHLIDKYNDCVKNSLEKICSNILQNQKLAEIRDFLLPLLMNGQVGVA